MSWWRRGASRAPAAARITLVDRAGCHLCDQAAAVLDRVSARAGAPWVRLDVDSSPHLLQQYDELVPVVLVDDRQVAHYVVTEEQVLKALRRRPPRARGQLGRP